MPIRMKALRSFGYAGVNEGPISRGHEFSVRDEHRARDLETQDPALAYRIEAKLPPKVNPDLVRSTENKASSAGPFPSVGGKTGADEPQPSSPPAPQRRRRRSKNSADDLLS